VPRLSALDELNYVEPALNFAFHFNLGHYLKAYRKWLTMEEPDWSDNKYPNINYQVWPCSLTPTLDYDQEGVRGLL